MTHLKSGSESGKLGARVSPDEALLIQVYREANPQGKKSILASAKGLAGDNPVPEADIQHLRRKDDTASH